ncbi:hypothetical protein [Pseudomonas fortuita]|uniref:hypothetical protein n=1 Tax=Pseudomonas fortuita TaxID=3233375 RepID=UPI003DA1A04C
MHQQVASPGTDDRRILRRINGTDTGALVGRVHALFQGDAGIRRPVGQSRKGMQDQAIGVPVAQLLKVQPFVSTVEPELLLEQADFVGQAPGDLAIAQVGQFAGGSIV